MTEQCDQNTADYGQRSESKLRRLAISVNPGRVVKAGSGWSVRDAETGDSLAGVRAISLDAEVGGLGVFIIEVLANAVDFSIGEAEEKG